MSTARATRIAVVLAAVVAALVLAAAAWAAAGDPQKAFEKRDQARARTFLLAAKDLPSTGWQTTPTDFSEANPACLVKSYSLSPFTVNGEAGLSHAYRGGVLLVESDGHVFRTAAQAKKAFAITTKPGLGHCIGNWIASGFQKSTPGITAKVTSVTPVAIRGLGVPARGFRIVIALKSKAVDTTTQLVSLQLLKGRELASLAYVSNGGVWPQVALRQLTSKVARRM